MNDRIAHRIRHTYWSRLAALAIAIAGSVAAHAEDFPFLRQGMWEFKRTVEGQGTGGKPENIQNRKCVDPGAEMKKTNETLARQGCTFSPLAKNGSSYSFSADCQMQGVKMQSRSVIVVQSDSAYRVEVTSTGAGTSTKELLIARRVGDCQP